MIQRSFCCGRVDTRRYPLSAGAAAGNAGEGAPVAGGIRRTNVAYWPKGDLGNFLADVRFRGRADIRQGSPNV
jgi:hypothetical protein